MNSKPDIPIRIGVITTCFNEELILPHFLGHYAGWDDVLVLLDEATTDNSAAVCRDFRNVTVEPCRMSAGLHELEKVAILQAAFNRGIGFYDWIAVLDSDELIIPLPPKMSVKLFLARNMKHDAIISIMFPVYRHVDDLDLDPAKPALPQRLHGRKWRANEVKPNVLRANKPKTLTIGMHTHVGGLAIAKDFFLGAHWADADYSIMKARRLARRARFSEENKQRGWGNQHFNVTEESLLLEAQEHMYDPLLKDLQDRI